MYLHKYFPKSDVSDQNSLLKFKCRKQIPQCTKPLLSLFAYQYEALVGR